MSLRSVVDGLIRRAFLTRWEGSGTVPRVQAEGEMPTDLDDDIQHLQPYGLVMRPVANAELVNALIGADPDQEVVLFAVARDALPDFSGLAEGEGGLHSKNGTWMVFLTGDDKVHLGAQTAAKKVALAEDVEAELTKIKAALDSVANGGGNHFTGPNTYTTVGDVGASNVFAE